MSEKTTIDKEKLSKIVSYASEELENNLNNAIGKDTIVSHVINKMKEVLKDDNK